MKSKQIQNAGTCASLNVGTSENQILQLDSNGKLPAVDGSNLTNITGSGGGTGVRNMVDITVTTTGTSIPSNLPNGTFIHVINNTLNSLILYLPLANSVSSGYYLTTAHYALNDLTSGDSTHSVLLKPNGSDSLDGDSGSTYLSLSRDSYTVVSDGSGNWMTIQRGRL